MNIGYMFESYQEKPTGINRYILSLTSELLKMDQNDSFYALEKNYLKLPISEPCKILSESGLDFFPLYAKQKKIDLIHSFFNAFDNISYPCKRILTVHDLIPMIHPEWFLPDMIPYFDKRIRKSCEMADIIVADSNSTKSDIVNCFNIPAEKIKVVYLGVDKNIKFDTADDRIIDKYSLQNGYFLFVSRIESRKNVKGLIEAFCEYRKSNPKSKVKLVIAGDKRIDVFNTVFSDEQEKMKDAIVFPGYVTDDELSALYKHCTAVCYISFYEGFGLPILEAMAAGKPVITSNISSMPEVGGDAVLYCDPYDRDSIVDAMMKLVNNEKLAKDLQNKALERVKIFSYTKAANEILNIYESLQ